MERLGEVRPRGLHAGALRAWGMLFVVAGIVGRSILQNRMLGVGVMSAEEMVQMMQSSQEAFVIATIALILQAMETVAIPIFVFLLEEGFRHTSDYRKYMLRVAAMAVLTEIPYDLAMQGKVLEFSAQNPALGLVLCMIVLYMFKRFAGKKLICVIMAVAGLLWGIMLKIDHSIPMVLMLCVMYLFRNKRMYMGFTGVAMAAVCSVVSPFYLAAAMGFLAIHFYNGEPGEGNRMVNYLFYPVVLLVIGLIAKFVI